MNDKNLFGRILALALILGTVYGVRTILRTDYGCESGCCLMGEHHDGDLHDGDHDDDHDAKAGPAKFDADGAPDEDDAKLEAKAPVVPRATTK